MSSRQRRGTSGLPTISDADWRDLLERRVTDPGAIAKAYAARRRPARFLSDRGTVFLVAADHPARGSLASGGDAMAMADRRSLLSRLVEALRHPDVDGVLGTPDIIEELLLLGVLEDKVVIGSMNRGGLDGATWTMDDRFTGYDAASIAACGLEGGKMLLRIDDSDAGTATTIEACAQAVTELAERQLVAMVEPLPYERDADGNLFLRKDGPALSRAVTIASGLGHHECLHLAEDAFVRRLRDGLRFDDVAVRRTRRSAQLGPGRGPRVLGQDAVAPGGAGARRRPDPALPARRRRRVGGARGSRGARRGEAGGLT